MKSFLEMHEKAEIIFHQRERLIDKGILTVHESYGEVFESIDSERVYSIAVESFLEELIENFKKGADKTNHMLLCMGVSAGDYFDKDVFSSLISSKDIDPTLIGVEHSCGSTITEIAKSKFIFEWGK